MKNLIGQEHSINVLWCISEDDMRTQNLQVVLQLSG